MTTLWTRLLNETSKAYRAFEVYRDLGAERSIQKEGKTLKKNAVALGRLSKKYDWVQRAKAYDAYIRQEKFAAMKKGVVELE